MKCLNLRFDDDTHKKVRAKCFNEEISMQQYIMNLILKDLDNDKKDNKK